MFVPAPATRKQSITAYTDFGKENASCDPSIFPNNPVPFSTVKYLGLSKHVEGKDQPVAK